MHDIGFYSSISGVLIADYRRNQHQEPLSLNNNKLPALSRYCYLFLCASACLAIILSGCVRANQKFASESIPVLPGNIEEFQNTLKRNEQLKKENKSLADQYSQQKELVAELQMSLLNKHREIDNYLQISEHLLDGVLRSNTKSLNPKEKVATAELAIEVTGVIIDTLKRSNLDSRKRKLVYWAQRYLSESDIEVQRKNYDGALYLCKQAIEQLQQTALFSRPNKIKKSTEEISFLSPLPMKLLKTSNLRNAPSMQAKVTKILEAGSLVTALGYKGRWVRVSFAEQKKVGWIHFSLLR